MATNSYLSSEAFNKAQEKYNFTYKEFNFKKLQAKHNKSKTFSLWLGDQLKQRLSEHPLWAESHPIALGSWARSELTPQSDIDLIFCGDEKKVLQLVQDWQEQGLKLRYRIPENYENWNQGVTAFDTLALLHAKAFTDQAQCELKKQQDLIIAWGKGFRRSLLKAMVEERKDRAKRYDSIANYLEPNIKFDQGGLRDLQQSLVIANLFYEQMHDSWEVSKILNFYKVFFLSIRQKLHLNGANDILVATEQQALSENFGFSDIKNFMREVQLGLSRVSFYGDWVIERARRPNKFVAEINKIKFTSFKNMFAQLYKNPTLLMQERIRREIRENKGYSKPNRRVVGALLNNYMTVDKGDKYLLALFRSNLLEASVPELKRVKGLVQHDQYHRYSVQAHIFQAMRELTRVYEKPVLLGKLKKWVRSFDKKDWKILIWTCLYHDIAKGRKGDHSIVGAKLVVKDLKEMGLPQSLIQEVSWMVENHFIISTAAFRRNPHAVQTWKDLHERGVRGKRLLRLGVFTAIDIIATNPEAWSSWKESLLHQLIEALTSKSATEFMKFVDKALVARVKLPLKLIKNLDRFLLEAVPAQLLIQDFKDLQSPTKKDLPLLIWRESKDILWIRFHQLKDETGLFLKFTRMLFAAGCRVREASVQVIADFGPYDWFRVHTNKSPQQLKKIFQIMQDQEFSLPKVKFDEITLVSRDENESILSFRGKDQTGALITAVQALSEQKLDIKWARVHTWGRQLDDIFSVSTLPEIKNIHSQLIKNYQK